MSDKIIYVVKETAKHHHSGYRKDINALGKSLRFLSVATLVGGILHALNSRDIEKHNEELKKLAKEAEERDERLRILEEELEDKRQKIKDIEESYLDSRTQ